MKTAEGKKLKGVELMTGLKRDRGKKGVSDRTLTRNRMEKQNTKKYQNTDHDRAPLPNSRDGF